MPFQSDCIIFYFSIHGRKNIQIQPFSNLVVSNPFKFQYIFKLFDYRVSSFKFVCLNKCTNILQWKKTRYFSKKYK